MPWSTKDQQPRNNHQEPILRHFKEEPMVEPFSPTHTKFRNNLTALQTVQPLGCSEIKKRKEFKMNKYCECFSIEDDYEEFFNEKDGYGEDDYDYPIFSMFYIPIEAEDEFYKQGGKDYDFFRDWTDDDDEREELIKKFDKSSFESFSDFCIHVWISEKYEL